MYNLYFISAVGLPCISYIFWYQTAYAAFTFIHNNQNGRGLLNLYYSINYMHFRILAQFHERKSML